MQIWGQGLQRVTAGFVYKGAFWIMFGSFGCPKRRGVSSQERNETVGIKKEAKELVGPRSDVLPLVSLSGLSNPDLVVSQNKGTPI